MDGKNGKVVLIGKSAMIEGKPADQWLEEKGINVSPTEYGVKIRNTCCADIQIHNGNGQKKQMAFSNTIVLLPGQALYVHGQQFVAVVT